jgi:hypothetical protein
MIIRVNHIRCTLDTLFYSFFDGPGLELMRLVLSGTNLVLIFDDITWFTAGFNLSLNYSSFEHKLCYCNTATLIFFCGVCECYCLRESTASTTWNLLLWFIDVKALLLLALVMMAVECHFFVFLKVSVLATSSLTNLSKISRLLSN